MDESGQIVISPRKMLREILQSPPPSPLKEAIETATDLRPPNELLDDARRTIAKTIERNWARGCIWFLRKQGLISSELPVFQMPEFEAWEPLGNFFHVEQQLCVALQNFMDLYSHEAIEGFENIPAVVRFQLLIEEMKRKSYHSIGSRTRTKTAVKKHLVETKKALLNVENPFPDYMPQHYNTFELTLAIVRWYEPTAPAQVRKLRKQIKEVYLRNFRDAITHLNSEFHSDKWRALRIDPFGNPVAIGSGWECDSLM